jgi:hypothetical protein
MSETNGLDVKHEEDSRDAQIGFELSLVVCDTMVDLYVEAGPLGRYRLSEQHAGDIDTR